MMIVASNSCDDIPIIDMEGGDAVGAEILKAFSSIGFATLTNHAIPQSVIDNAFACSKAFFSLPLDQKMKRKYEGHASNRGYIPMGCEAFISENPEKKETFDMGKDEEVGYQNKWPTDELTVSFKEVMLEYFERFDALHLRIMKLLAVAWNMLDENFFVDRCNEKHANLRLLHYPSVAKTKKGLVQRGAVHTDFGTLTLLTQDSVGGLRAQRMDGAWVTVPPIPGSIVINVGDMFQRWSNDVLRATPHQVVELPKSPSDPSNRDDHDESIPERYSIAFFCNANKNVLLECLNQCVSDENPPRYPSVNAHDYLTMRLSQTISAGQ
jgi:isopenicillin N synthase-like dioxygenase